MVVSARLASPCPCHAQPSRAQPCLDLLTVARCVEACNPLRWTASSTMFRGAATPYRRFTLNWSHILLRQ
ncbi:hypothetical protein SEA_KLEIN_35 [Mycobacterium phage Klein]|nr:hypothetical protein SEA_KLEIN_35 [Mycobacterium phage Klein]